MRSIEIRDVFSACLYKRAAIFCLGLLTLFAPLVHASDALNYTKNYFVTGDYVVGSVGLWSSGNNPVGTITLSGVPQGADIVAAFLYWETAEASASPSGANGVFDGNAIVGDPRGNPNTLACGSGGNLSPNEYAHVYRADVLRYLPVDTTNSIRIANGQHKIQLVGGKGATPQSAGASLLVVYRMLTTGAAPLRAVVIYDGDYTMANSTGPMTQVMGGFYQASRLPAAKMTQIVANGQPGFSESLEINNSIVGNNPFRGAQGSRWDSPTFNYALTANAATVETNVKASGQSCLTWAVIVTSMNVQDTDGDGLLDIWETSGLHLNPGTATQPATFGTCQNYVGDGFPCVNLPAMGAKPAVKDIFIEIDWEHGTDGHLHIPKIAALSMMATVFGNHGIQLHFDVGNNYQSQKTSYIIPALYAQGGQVIEESTLLCPNAQTSVCAYPGLPYAVQGWKIGFQAIKDGFPLLNIPAYFAHDRKDTFHYVLFGHAYASPSSVPGVPNSVSGVADRPGGDVMVTLGLWLADDPVPCDPTIDCINQTGSAQVQAGTLMHELGHNLGLSHAGLYRVPNCESNYPSVMNYLYQARGLTDANGGSNIDYSYGLLPQLNESSLSENVFQNTPLTYQVVYYGPPTSLGIGLAKAHCDGSPLNGEAEARLTSPIGKTIDWDNDGKIETTLIQQDIDFNGTIGSPVNDSVNPLVPAGNSAKRWLLDTNDWAILNLQQIGARSNVAGLSADVGQADLGQADLGQADLGQADLGQADLGQADLGQADLGQADLGQADLGDVDYDTVISTLDATSSSQPLTNVSSGTGAALKPNLAQAIGAASIRAADAAPPASSALTGVTLQWGAPGLGQIRQYNIYRTDPLNPNPVMINSVTGAPPATTYTDTVNQTQSVGPAPKNSGSGMTFYNTTYTYFIASVDVNGTSSGPSNSASGTVDHVFITANPQTRVYGAANPSLSFTTAGITPSGETGTTICTTVPLTSNAGTYTNQITCSGLTPVGGVTYIPGTFTITPAPLTITAVLNKKTYDSTVSAAATPAVTGLQLLTSKVPPDSVTATETYDTKNVGTGKTLSIASYNVSDGNNGGNYTVTTVAQPLGEIDKAPLTITATGVPKVYDSTTAATVTLSDNRFTGDIFTDSYSSARFANKNAAPSKTVSVTGISISGLDAGNYTFNTTATATAAITPAPLTITAVPNSKVYDGTTSASAKPTTSGLLGTDIVTGLAEIYAGKNVGTGLTLTVSAYIVNDGNSGGNYTVTPVSNTAGVITQAPLTIAAVPNSKTYDGTTSAAATPSVSGLQTGDSVTGQVETYAGKNVGTGLTLSVTAYTVNDGNNGLNYAISTPTSATGVITKAPLTITAATNSKPYDGTTSAAATPTTSGLKTGDTVTGLVEVYNTKNAGTGLTLSVTSYTVNDGNSGGNYTVTLANVNTGIITALPIAVTANPQSKTYGQADPPLTYGVRGTFLLGDGLSGALTRVAGEDAGTYAIQQGTLTAGGNYAIAFTGALLTILPASQTITFAPLANMTYGAPDFPVTATASSLLPVSFAGSRGCTVTAGGTVHLTNSGLCTVTASQLGSLDYLAAPPVSQSFTVATLYTSDSTLADFTSPITTYGTFTTGTTDGNSFAFPYTPTVSNIAAGLRVIGDGNEGPINVTFPSAVSKIRVFPNIDHVGASYDGYQYTISGSNDGVNFTPLFNATSVTGSGEPFTLGTFTGTAPFSVNNVLTAGAGPDGTVGYEADFSFSQAYRYYSFGASTQAINSGNADQELTAVGALQ